MQPPPVEQQVRVDVVPARYRRYGSSLGKGLFHNPPLLGVAAQPALWLGRLRWSQRLSGFFHVSNGHVDRVRLSSLRSLHHPTSVALKAAGNHRTLTILAGWAGDFTPGERWVVAQFEFLARFLWGPRGPGFGAASSINRTMSLTSQSRSVMPTSIAGVTLRVW